jgi:hypothetical protein
VSVSNRWSRRLFMKRLHRLKERCATIAAVAWSIILLMPRPGRQWENDTFSLIGRSISIYRYLSIDIYLSISRSISIYRYLSIDIYLSISRSISIDIYIDIYIDIDVYALMIGGSSKSLVVVVLRIPRAFPSEYTLAQVHGPVMISLRNVHIDIRSRTADHYI